MKSVCTKDFFFCYDRKLAKFLRYDKGIEFITKAFTRDGKEFCLFYITAEVNQSIEEYKGLNG